MQKSKALPPDMQALLDAMRGVIREEVQEAVNRRVNPHAEGEDSSSEDDVVTTLTRKMEDLQ